MRKWLYEKLNVDWDVSNEGKKYSLEEKKLIESLNKIPRKSLERQIKTIEIAKKLKRNYYAIKDQSEGYGESLPNRSCMGVDWEAEASSLPYTIEELILMANIAVHKRAPQGSVTRLAVQYGRTPWALTVRISKMRKTGEWKKWLDYEQKQMARV